MSLTVHLPSDLGAVLKAEAARRGPSTDQVAADLLAERLPTIPTSDPMEAFIGTADSGDAGWAETHTSTLRAEAAARRTGHPG